MDDVDLAQTPVISYASRTRPHRELTSALAQRVGPKMRVFTSASISASLRMIAAGIAVGPYPKVLAAPFLAAGEVVEFDPDLPLSPLEFTASYLAEPRSMLIETSAEMAQDVAQQWHATHTT
jgi:DNA-binding transcriptional LysR family regulator